MKNNHSKTKDELIAEIELLQKELFLLKKRDKLKVKEERVEGEGVYKNEILKQLLEEQLPQKIFIKDITSRYITCNKKFSDELGTTPNEITGKDDYDFYPPDLAGLFRENDRKVLESGQLMVFEEKYTKNEKEFWINTIKIPYRDNENRIIGVIGILNDITYLKQTEAKFKSISDLVENSLNEIYVFDTTSFKFLYGNKVAIENLGYSKSELYKLTAFEIKPDFTRETFTNFLQPIFKGEKNKLVFETFHRRKDGSTYFVEVHLQLSNFDGEKAFVAIILDITNRKQAEEALEKEKSLLDALMDNFKGSIYFKDKHSRFLRICAAQAKKFGLQNSSEAIGKSDFDFFTQEHAQSAFNDEQQIILTGEPITIEEKETWSYKPDTWVSSTKMPLFNNHGEIIGTFGISMDITEKKLAQERLIKSEASYRTLFEHAPDGIFIADANGYYKDVNKAGALMIGYEYNEIIGMHISNVFIPSKSNSIDQLLTLAQKKNFHLREWQFKRKDGTIFTGEVISTEMPDGNMLGIARDITLRKETENKLLESERVLSTLVDNLPGMAYRQAFDRNWTTHFISQSCYKITGYHPDELINNKTVSFNDIIVEEFREPLWELWHRVIAKKSTFTYEYQIRKPDGEIRWVWERGQGVYGPDGKVIYLEGYIEDITEQKMAQKELLESRKYLWDFFEDDISADLLFTPEGKLLFCNKTFVKLFGFSLKEEALNYPITGLFVQPTSFTDIINKIHEKRKIENYACDCLSVNGKILHTIFNTVGEYDNNQNLVNIRAYIIDITEKVLAEKQVRLLERAVEQNSAAIIITDKNGIIQYVNKACAKLTGYSADELLGNSPRVLKSGRQNDLFYKDLWDKILTGSDWQGELQNKKKNGELYWEYAIITPLFKPDGDISHFIAIKEDVTEKKELIDSLVVAKTRAEESDRLKSAFLANMSHEIRTPMNGILGFAELLKSPDLTNEKHNKYINIIEKSGVRMLNIINDIVDISKIEAGQMEIQLGEVNINEQIEYLFNFFKPEADKKGLDLSFKLSLSTPRAFIITDREKVYAILLNLIKNAIKFTQKGFIEFGYIKTTGKKQGEELEKPELEFFVKDSGKGIQPSRQDAIFERFIQEDIEDRMAMQGAGLGLSITKAYVEMLGGKIWVESKPGVGSTFYFTLPFNNKKLEGRDENPVEVSSAPDPKLKILIVEDDSVSEELTTLLLSNFNREIIKAVTGLEAVEITRKNPDIDLILMDIGMPDMDGYEATKLIREFNKYVIIIAQTAYCLAGDKEKAIESGCNNYLPKPIDRNKLAEMINEYFG